MKTTIVTAGTIAATAATGAVAANPGSAWYRSLRKPRWQPPPPAYALVWTPLFFRARLPRAALAEIACLNIANVLLIRQTWRADRTAAVLLLHRVRHRAERRNRPAEPQHLSQKVTCPPAPRERSHAYVLRRAS